MSRFSVRSLAMALLACGCLAFSGGCFDFGGPVESTGTFAPLNPGPTDDDAPEEFTTTESGLKYRILRKSDGIKPTSVNTVSVNYKGWLDSGKVFDSTYERRAPAELRLSNVVDGWKEGISLIGEGGMIELDVPPELGYGAKPPPGIPKNARMHFIVELESIVR